MLFAVLSFLSAIDANIELFELPFVGDGDIVDLVTTIADFDGDDMDFVIVATGLLVATAVFVITTVDLALAIGFVDSATVFIVAGLFFDVVVADFDELGASDLFVIVGKAVDKALFGDVDGTVGGTVTVDPVSTLLLCLSFDLI